MSAPPTTAAGDVAEAFLRLCEALGIQASALAYLEAPAILRAAEARGAERERSNMTQTDITGAGRCPHGFLPQVTCPHCEPQVWRPKS